MFTSRSEQSTPPELSIASVFTRPPAERVLDPPALRDAEVAALADHLRAQLGGVHAHARRSPCRRRRRGVSVLAFT